VPFLIAAAIAGVNAVVAIRRLPETRSVVVGHAGATEDAQRVADLPSLDGPGLVEPAHLDLVSAGHHPTTAAGGDQEGAAAPDGDTRRTIVRLIVAAFTAVAAFAAFEATFSLLVEERFGLSLAATGAVFAVIGIELVVVQGLLVGPVSERLGERGTLMAGLGLNAVGLVLLVPDAGWATLVPAVGLLVLGQGLTTPTLSSAVAGRAASQRGRWLGWQQSAGALARVVGPAAAGALFGHVGPGVPYAVGAALMVVALAVVAGVAPASAEPHVTTT
jgi:DHA1 family tetracycline resistance protein-like MFS transporter